VFSEETKYLCNQFYQFLIENYDGGSGLCFDHGPGYITKDLLALQTRATLAACFFRFHCVTRLIGVTDTAVGKSPPPLFNYTSTNSTRITQWIENANCDFSVTLNQLFQSHSRCVQTEPLISLFCSPPQCFVNLANGSVSVSEWCNANSTCNLILNDYGRYCFSEVKDETVWKESFERKYPVLSDCSTPIEKLFPASNLINRLVSSDGSDIPVSDFIPSLPYVRERNGQRCNAGSHECGCLIPPPAGVRQATAGAGGLCATGLYCDASGRCQRVRRAFSDAVRAHTSILLGAVAMMIITLT